MHVSKSMEGTNFQIYIHLDKTAFINKVSVSFLEERFNGHGMYVRSLSNDYS